MIALRVALVLAMAFAFHPIRPADDGAGEGALAFVLAAGDPADICADGGDPGHPGHGECLACQLAGSPGASGPPLRPVAADLQVVLRVVPANESRVVRMVRDPGRGLRAPPVDA